MEEKVLFRAGIKRHKGSLLGIGILLFLTTLSLCMVLTVYLTGGKYVRQELERAGFGDLTAWVSEVPDMRALTESIKRQDGIAGTQTQAVIFAEYEGNGVESDSEGQLILWEPSMERYRFLKGNLSGYQDAPKEIGTDEVFVSPSMLSIMNLRIGDTITFQIARNSQNIELTVAGYYEDPFMGSSMIGMKGFLVSKNSFEKIRMTIRAEGMDALAREGGMVHITADPDVNMEVSELNRRLNENTPLSQYTEFVHSKEAIGDFMTILQNAFCGLLAAFALILLGVGFIVLGHSISGMIDQDWKNLGVLKTIGFTGGKLIRIHTMQYGVSVLAGLVSGLLTAIPAAGMVGRMIVTTTGLCLPVGLPVLPCLEVFGILLLLLCGFTLLRLRKICGISPIGAIQGEHVQSGRGYVGQIQAKGLIFHMALRQILSGKRWYVGACIVSMLLVFFASLAGRMNGWLGADGKGMMDAFNPADLDIGVQSLGDLGAEKMEQEILSYSEITDSYMLAMPSVSVNGNNYTANVISEPERLHISRGETCENPSEVVLTEILASDLGVDVGDRVTIRGDAGTEKFTVSGIYHCANDMGANLGMSREGYFSIGRDDARLWCYHYFLAEPSQKQAITEKLENTYGGDVHVHENTWPGLFGIINAMHLMILFMYGMSAVFICIVTAMVASKLLEAERIDLGIYRSIGCSAQMLRVSFILRFGIVAFVGAVIGTAVAAIVTDPFVSMVMRAVGISNFKSHPTFDSVLIPGLIIVVLFLLFSYLASGKIKRADMTVLTAE